MALLILLTLLIWKGNIDPAERLLRMTFLDVGQGDSIFVEFPGKGNMLVDAGSGGEEGRFDIGRSVVAPFLWNKGMRRIDALVVTHSHEDHLGGAIFILKNFDIGCVIDNGIRYSGESSLLEEYLALIRGKHIRHIEAVSPTELTGFGEVNILILNPPADAAGMAENDRSIVLKIIYKNFSALLCGDVTEAGIGNLLHTEGILKSDLLKVPHHGGGTGDLERKKYFFKKIDPVVYIISASDKGRQKGAVKYRTQDIITSGAISYVTKDDGAVMIATDGHSFKGKSESGKKTNFFILYLDNRYII
jgi:competence protein ComEC